MFFKSSFLPDVRCIRFILAEKTQQCVTVWFHGVCCNVGGVTHNPPVSSGSPYRDEITLGILQLQENNRLEILKRRWWEGGQCPKEEDHRAKGGCCCWLQDGPHIATSQSIPTISSAHLVPVDVIWNPI